MLKIIALFGCTLLTISCEHSGYDVTNHTGEYRYHTGIGEFYDCNSQNKYYLSEAGISDELKVLYKDLNLQMNEDVFIKVTGYLREEPKMEGIDPEEVFVAVKLIDHDVDRGCKIPIRKGY